MPEDAVSKESQVSRPPTRRRRVVVMCILVLVATVLRGLVVGAPGRDFAISVSVVVVGLCAVVIYKEYGHH